MLRLVHLAPVKLHNSHINQHRQPSQYEVDMNCPVYFGGRTTFNIYIFRWMLILTADTFY